MGRSFFFVGACLAIIAVAGGAFGAHFLKSVLSASNLQVFEIGIRYQMYHALALCLVGVRFQQTNSSWLVRAGTLFILGIIIFSGSLYLLSFSGMRWLGAMTPLGGLALLVGWSCVAIGEYQGIKK